MPDDTTLPSDEIWRSVHSDEYPDLLFTKAHRDELIVEVSQMYAEWVIDGIERYVDHYSDPPWDHSGSVSRRTKSSKDLLAKYATIGEWMQEEFTGNTMASYESGMGFFHDTFSREVEQIVSSKVIGVWTNDMNEDEQETFLEKDPTENSFELEHNLMLMLEELTTKEAWVIGETPAKEAIAQEEAEQAKHQQEYEGHRRLAKEFWSQHMERGFSSYGEAKKTFSSLPRIARKTPAYDQFFHTLDRALEHTTKLVLEAIIAVGLPCSQSNTVATDIKNLAQNKLSELARLQYN